MAVRAAVAADAAEVARLSTLLGYPASAAQMQARLAEVLRDAAGQRVCVAPGEAGGLRGWIHVARRAVLEAEPRAEILGLVVDAPARGQGVGRALVLAAEHWALERGLQGMVVRSSTARQESHPFYQRLGYDRQKSQHVYARWLPRRAGPGGAPGQAVSGKELP